MITLAQAGLQAVVALARGHRLDGVLSPVFSPAIVTDENGDPVADQPAQPIGTIIGGVVSRSDGDRVQVDFGGAGWADAPLTVLELVTPAPRPVSATRGGDDAAAAAASDQVRALLDRCDRLQARVDVLEIDAAARAESAKRATSPTARFVTAGELESAIRSVAGQIVDAKTQGIAATVAEVEGLARRAVDDIATLDALIAERDKAAAAAAAAAVDVKA